MKHSEAAVILAKIAAYDRRTVGDADVQAWVEALDGQVTVQDALTAVRDHFRESSDWLMPKAVIDRARKIRFARIRDAGEPDYPQGLTAAQEREWLRRWHVHLGRGSEPDPAAAQYLADRELGITRVESQMADPAKVRQLLADFAATRSVPVEQEPTNVH